MGGTESRLISRIPQGVAFQNLICWSLSYIHRAAVLCNNLVGVITEDVTSEPHVHFGKVTKERAERMKLSTDYQHNYLYYILYRDPSYAAPLDRYREVQELID